MLLNRPKTSIILYIPIFLVLFSAISIYNGYHQAPIKAVKEFVHPSPPSLPPPPIYKKVDNTPPIPITDNFPYIQHAQTASDLPRIATYNAPPQQHVAEQTPLMIGFTRNWRLLQQVVVSYITAGWPPEDIYVVENTGVMDSNAKGLLSLQNPFFLNHTRLHLLGVNIISTPTLLTFAQLQNFYIHTALIQGWETYFWGHEDIVVISDEEETPYQSFYSKAVGVLREVLSPNFMDGPDSIAGKWGIVHFAFDWLALVHTSAYIDVGGWDTQIPFYMTDCDFHNRLVMGGYPLTNRKVGQIFDVASTFDDLSVLYRLKDGPEPSFHNLATGKHITPETIVQKRTVATSPQISKHNLESRSPVSPPTVKDTSLVPSEAVLESDSLNSTAYHNLVKIATAIAHSKNNDDRNTWQARQSGGQGEPFYRDAAGFEKGIKMAIDHGREVYAEKWGHRECDLYSVGYKASDAWLVEHDWEPVT